MVTEEGKHGKAGRGSETYRNGILTVMMILTAVIAYELRPKPAKTRYEPELSPIAEKILDRRIPHLVVNHGTYREAVRQMEAATGAPISVDWGAIPNRAALPVSVELRDVTLGDAIAYIFDVERAADYGLNDPEQVDFEVVNGTLFVTSAMKVPTYAMTCRIYDVRDLLHDRIWSMAAMRDRSDTQRERCSEIANLIQLLCGARNWGIDQYRPGSYPSPASYGPPYGQARITSGAGRLFVLQTTWGHRRVEAFLERLRNGGIPPNAE